MMLHEQMNQGTPDKDGRSSLDAKLLAYCAMAGGALLAAQPADAAVVYSGIKNLSLSDNKTVGVDLDSNGTVDFTFLNFPGKSTFTTQKRLLLSWFKTYTYTNFRKFQSNGVNLDLNPQNAIAHKGALGKPLDPAKVMLSKGDAIPGKGIQWVDEKWANMLPLSYHGSTRIVTDPAMTTDSVNQNKIGGAFDNTTGYLGVRFQIDNTTHYGWIRYKGDNSTDVDNGTALKASIVDWSYEDTPFEPMYIDAEAPAPPCTLALTPGRISKALSLISPVTGIIIRGNESATFTNKSAINWGSDTVKTLFKIRLSKRTILALVRVSPLLLQGEDTYEVTVDDCSGELNIAPF